MMLRNKNSSGLLLFIDIGLKIRFVFNFFFKNTSPLRVLKSTGYMKLMTT